ncbi:ATP-binding protein [Streptomyces otsuchiensis]|uniref:ATP-binding protein n=1 Tax=Streptomyces otsuchiensis TaxID=2681388 RepID=UPI001D132491|nr:ATP-binding protein [Streptomyces otsuchiensis]
MISSSTSTSRHCAVQFQALPSRIGQVRRIVGAQLRRWGLPQLVDPAALGVTELLANIHLHAASDKFCTVELLLLRGRLTISVQDHDPRLPHLRHAAQLAVGGRGLALVAAIGDSWGSRARADGGGKIVWFTLPVPDSAGGSGEGDERRDAGRRREEVSMAPDDALLRRSGVV